MFILGWLLGAILAATIFFVFMAAGLRGIRKDQEKQNPLDKESNFWW
jgi:hypothetical protein